MRRGVFFLLTLACNPASPPPPEPAPVREPTPPPIPPPLATPPADTKPPPAEPATPTPTFHIAAIGDDSLTMTALGDAVAVFDEHLFAVAAPPSAALVVQPTGVPWTGEFAQPDQPGGNSDVDAELGGRWPDAVFITENVAGTRAVPEYRVHRLQAGKWRPAPLLPTSDLLPFYAMFAPWRDGAALAVQLWAISESYDENSAAELPRPRLVRVDTTREPRPPALPADVHDISLFSASATGAISLITRDDRLHRWTPVTRQWQQLPAPESVHGNLTRISEDPDGALTYMTCDNDGRRSFHRRVDDAWTAIDLPSSSCVMAYAGTAAAMWVVLGNALLHGTGEPRRWRNIELPRLFVPNPRLDYSDRDGWVLTDLPFTMTTPPDRRWALRPTDVLILGDSVWVLASWQGGAVVLVDHPVPAPVEYIRPVAPARPAQPSCDTLFLRLAAPSADATPPADVIDVIAAEESHDLALVIAADGPQHTPGLVWLPSLLRPPDSVDADPTLDTAAAAVARKQLTDLGTTIAALWPTATPTLQCWTPRIEQVLASSARRP